MTRAIVNGKYVFQIAWKRALSFKAIPAWSRKSTNRRKILRIYIDAQIRNITSRSKFQVDHIIPLYSEYVCGLHVHENLQVLSSLRNQAKSNLFSPYREVNGRIYPYFKVNTSIKGLKISKKRNPTRKNPLKLAKKRLKVAKNKSLTARKNKLK